MFVIWRYGRSGPQAGVCARLGCGEGTRVLRALQGKLPCPASPGPSLAGLDPTAPGFRRWPRVPGQEGGRGDGEQSLLRKLCPQNPPAEGKG